MSLIKRNKKIRQIIKLNIKKKDLQLKRKEIQNYKRKIVLNKKELVHLNLIFKLKIKWWTKKKNIFFYNVLFLKKLLWNIHEKRVKKKIYFKGIKLEEIVDLYWKFKKFLLKDNIYNVYFILYYISYVKENKEMIKKGLNLKILKKKEKKKKFSFKMTYLYFRFLVIFYDNLLLYQKIKNKSYKILCLIRILVNLKIQFSKLKKKIKLIKILFYKKNIKNVNINNNFKDLTLRIKRINRITLLSNNIFIKFTIFQLIYFSIYIGHSRYNSVVFSSWFIYGLKNFICLINLWKTMKGLIRLNLLISTLILGRGNILFVNQRIGLSTYVVKKVLQMNQSYFVGNWIGGLLTNYKTLYTNLFIHFNKIIKHNLYGILRLSRLPNLLCISSYFESKIVALEGNIIRIPILSIIDTNVDSRVTTHPVFGNDHAFSSIYFYFESFYHIIKKFRINLLFLFKNIMNVYYYKISQFLIYKRFLYLLKIKKNNLSSFLFMEKNSYNLFFFIVWIIYYNQFLVMFIRFFNYSARYDFFYIQIINNLYKNSNMFVKSDLIFLK